MRLNLTKSRKDEDEEMTNEQSEQLMIFSRMNELELILEMSKDGKTVDVEAIKERKKELNEQLKNTMR